MAVRFYSSTMQIRDRSVLVQNPPVDFINMVFFNHAATQNARVSIEQWLLTRSNRPGYHWKSERTRNLFLYLTI